MRLWRKLRNETKATVPARSFGADDRPKCLTCGAPTILIRRTPHKEYGYKFERQTFVCRDCRAEIQRSVDVGGKLYG